ncbi:MAG: DUF2384 domain-containing protein [Acidobacteriaceae bacterium]|nr:DUF2384 domain-containing protein [Acidobacteriaceae bacterium]
MASLVDEQKSIEEEQSSSKRPALSRKGQPFGMSSEGLNDWSSEGFKVLIEDVLINRNPSQVRTIDLERQIQESDSPVKFDVVNYSLANTWVHGHLPKQQINDIRTLAEEALGDPAAALSWLCEPNMAADDRPPIQLLGTPEGFGRVKNLLLRIQYGVLA